jgi:hypothetical protein
MDQPEVCNGLDDNCNGVKDEGDPGGGEPCTVPGKEGECAFGTTTCSKAGKIECLQNVQPQPEVCDGKDNNCDGKVDNDSSDVGDACLTGLQGLCAAGTVTCDNGKVTCTENTMPMAETCNGLDDDCNGTPDDGFPGAGQPCTVAGLNPNSPCAQGQTNCLTGQNGCTQVVFASEEICDGIDNDCNGTIDDPASVSGITCDTGLSGVCSTGKTQCSAGASTCVPDIAAGSQIEVCDGKDNDCNGMKDDIPDIKLECAGKNPTSQNVKDWACTAATCQVAGCNGNFQDCDGAPGNGCEVNTGTDAGNCGACGTACNATNGSPTCQAGQCGIVCLANFGNCDGNAGNGCEQPLSGDIKNCGSCGKACDETNGTPNCNGGTCQIQCNGGFGDCDNNASTGCETNTTTSTAHCGACGKACNSTNGIASCGGGTCSIVCNPGFADCDGNAANGCETNLKADTTNCGGCGTLCSSQSGTAQCNNGTCGIVCLNGFADCNGVASDGCEVNLNTTVTNCGTCGKVCDNTNGTATCSGGACGIQCQAGFANCDGNVANGCEIDLKNDETNCNSCGKVCNSTNGLGICTAGACGILCNPGFANCDNVVQNGCEINVKTDHDNCGTCGSICNAQATCQSGACNIGSCPAGTGNCDNNAANGCETNVTSSTANCGSCGTVCAAVNGTNSCANSACSPSCNGGFGNCDGNGANGCEADLNTNINNCGVCGKNCVAGNASSTSWRAGACKPICNAGFGDCDGKGENGCETNTSAGVPGGGQISNCGACGNTCSVANGAPSCTNGTCGIQSCSGAFANCDGSYANGCESNTNSDVNNCGGCGNKCSAAGGTPSCTNGVCGISCSAGFGNCDGSAANGCEKNLTNDSANCGTCGTTCTGKPGVASASCASSACKVDSCTPTFYNQNTSYSDGCECTEDTVGNTCGAAKDLGSVAVGGSLAAVVGNLVGPGNADEDWYKVTFTTTASCSYHPKVTLSAGSEPIKMQVFTSCAGSVASGSFTCGGAPEAANSNLNSDTWEYTNKTTCGDNASIDPTPANSPGSLPYISTPNVIFIKVLRTGAATTCFPYTLTIKN